MGTARLGLKVGSCDCDSENTGTLGCVLLRLRSVERKQGWGGEKETTRRSEGSATQPGRETQLYFFSKI